MGVMLASGHARVLHGVDHAPAIAELDHAPTAPLDAPHLVCTSCPVDAAAVVVRVDVITLVVAPGPTLAPPSAPLSYAPKTSPPVA